MLCGPQLNKLRKDFLTRVLLDSFPDPDQDPVGSEIICLHGSGSGSVIGWFPGSGSGSKIIYDGSLPSNFVLKQ